MFVILLLWNCLFMLLVFNSSSLSNPNSIARLSASGSYCSLNSCSVVLFIVFVLCWSFVAYTYIIVSWSYPDCTDVDQARLVDRTQTSTITPDSLFRSRSGKAWKPCKITGKGKNLTQKRKKDRGPRWNEIVFLMGWHSRNYATAFHFYINNKNF